MVTVGGIDKENRESICLKGKHNHSSEHAEKSKLISDYPNGPPHTQLVTIVLVSQCMCVRYNWKRIGKFNRRFTIVMYTLTASEFKVKISI